MTASQAAHGDPKRYRAGCRCQTCRDGWAADTRARRRARAALSTPATGGGHQADNLTSTWAAETPYTGQITPHPRSRGECSQCGAATTLSTPRGTFVWCGECPGWRPDASTSHRTAVALRRMDADEQRARQLAAASKASQPRALADQLDIAERIGTVRGALAATITAISGAPTFQLTAQAAGITARLQHLDAMVKACASQPDPLAALNNLEAALSTEAARAEQLWREIEAARGAIESAEAMEQQRRQLTAAPEPPALPRAARPRVPDPLARTTLEISTLRQAKGLCGLRHRVGWRTATRILEMANTRTGPEKRIQICAEHNPISVCKGYGYRYYWITELARTEARR